MPQRSSYDPRTAAKAKTLLSRYRKMRSVSDRTKALQLKEGFLGIRREMRRLRSHPGTETARGFNVFRILGVEENEDCTHTPVLANLLDPQGSHGQGTMFLDAFIRRCQRKKGFISPGRKARSALWFVETQRFTQLGTIDLVVSAPGLGYIIVVENKVYAGEQRDQLDRYHRWLQVQRHKYPRQMLVFLTPSGQKSATAGQAKCVRLSYHRDIAEMLDSTVSKIGSPRVRELVRQYCEVARGLSTQENDNEE